MPNVESGRAQKTKSSTWIQSCYRGKLGKRRFLVCSTRWVKLFHGFHAMLQIESVMLLGVHAVVHVASPTPFYSNHVEVSETQGIVYFLLLIWDHQVAVKGSINLFNQAYAAGVRKFIFISSIYSVFTDFNHLLDSSRRFDHNSRYFSASVPLPFLIRGDLGWGTAPEYFRIQSKKCLGDLRMSSSIYKLIMISIPTK